MDNEGKCGTHVYSAITKVKMDAIIEQLKKHGTVTGNNPWDYDTGQHGVKLRGTWDPAKLTLSIIVTDKNWYVPCSKVWDTIDDLIHHIQTISVNDINIV